MFKNPSFSKMKYFLIFILFGLDAQTYGMLAGGRPNAFSEGNNAFAGVVNPANAVWIADRIDIGAFWVHQKANLKNRDHNPLFPPGTTDLVYKSKSLLTADFGVHKQVKLNDFESSFSLAAYTVPSVVKLRTKEPIRISGTSPLSVRDKTNVVSAVFSIKLNSSHSVGFTVDYLRFSHLRNGFQNSDNPLRSVSPGHVTNNGRDHSSGIGGSLGWRWKITESLSFGAAWTRKSYGGQYRKYRGFEPHHAKNYTPQTLGGGFSYRFNSHIAGRLEVLWTNLGNLPNANNSVLSNGRLNFHKRGSNKSPGPGLNDATYINIGLGYKVNSMLSIGSGFSHRIKLNRNESNFISHSYRRQTIYNTLSLGANFRYDKHDLFFVSSYGFPNRVSGRMPLQLGGGRFASLKQNTSLSLSWGYMY